jgi:hypothetical protein
MFSPCPLKVSSIKRRPLRLALFRTGSRLPGLDQALQGAGKVRHPSVGGYRGKCAMREFVHVRPCRNRTGRQQFLPHEIPPPGAVRYYFSLWHDEGPDQDIHHLLR